MSAKVIRVFLASPADIAVERQIFFELLPELGPPMGVVFVPTGYEVVQSVVGDRPQDLINREVDACDIFVAVFHRRWGQEAPDSVASGSYTEEEFLRALRRFGKTGMPVIFCFFKNVDLHALADPGPQLTKVLEFRRRLENSGQVLYRTFDSEDAFAHELELHLKTYVLKRANELVVSRKRILLPIPADEGPEVGRDRDLAVVSQARAAAAAGQLEIAERLFAKVSQATLSIAALETAKEFFDQIGNGEASHAVLDRKLALLSDRSLAAHEYWASLKALGFIDNMIKANLAATSPHDREQVEVLLRALFGLKFDQLMIDLLSENFTLGEIRALAKFYSGEAATVSSKMGDFIGRVVPPAIQRLQAEVAQELEK